MDQASSTASETAFPERVQPSARLTHPKYRPDIDGLRAVAVLSVIAFHAFPNRFAGGFIGVDVFFVISGYLISSILFENLQRDSFSFGTFYARRIRRIFPALLAVLACTLALGWAILFDNEFRQLAWHAAAGAGFVANFAQWSESGYFDADAISKPLLHLWSLGVEEQFYIIWPLLVLLAWRLRTNLLALALLIATASFALGITTGHRDPVGLFYSPATRFWELLAGAVLAYLAVVRNWPQAGPRRWRTAASLAGLGLIAGGCLLLNQDRLYPGWWALIPILGAALLITAGPAAPVNRWLLSHPLAVWIGLISYPLYLWHWPLLSYAHTILGIEPGKPARLAIIAVAILLSWLTYHLIERGVRHSSSRWMLASLVIAMSLIGAGALLAYKQGVPTRLGASPLPSSRSREVFTASRSGNNSCRTLLGLQPVPEEICLTTSAHPTVLFAGDSHAMALYSSILARRVPLAALLISGHDCEVYPTLSYTPTHQFTWGNNCTGIAQAVLDAARSIASIQTIVLAPAARKASRTESSIYRLSDNELSQHDAIVRGTDDLLAALQPLHKRVIYLRDVPHFERVPAECIQRLPLFRPPDCRIDRVAFDATRAEYEHALDEISAAHPEVRFIDPEAMFCGRRLCDQRNAGGYLYEDAHHLSVYGSEQLLKRYFSDLQPTGTVPGPVALDRPAE